jgi:hypothetical protein
MSILIKSESKIHKSLGLYEVWTFSGNEQKTCFSNKLHKLNFIASCWGKNIEIYKDFNFCENLYLFELNKKSN